MFIDILNEVLCILSSSCIDVSLDYKIVINPLIDVQPEHSVQSDYFFMLTLSLCAASSSFSLTSFENI
jgi:hypothetical protein